MSGKDPRCPHGKIEHAVSIARAAAAGCIGRFNFFLMDVTAPVLEMLGGDAPNKQAVKLKFDVGILEAAVKQSVPEAAIRDWEKLEATGQEVMAAAFAYSILVNDITGTNSGLPQRRNRKILGFCNSVKGAMLQARLVHLLVTHFASDHLHPDDPNEFFCGVDFSETVSRGESAAKMTVDEQDRELSLFKLAKRGVLYNFRLIDIGYDFPGINSVLFAEPCRSTERLIQAQGRGSRAKEGYDVFCACPADPNGDKRAEKILNGLVQQEEQDEDFQDASDGDQSESEDDEAPAAKRRRREPASYRSGFNIMRETLAKAFVDELLVSSQYPFDN